MGGNKNRRSVGIGLHRHSFVTTSHCSDNRNIINKTCCVTCVLCNVFFKGFYWLLHFASYCRFSSLQVFFVNAASPLPNDETVDPTSVVHTSPEAAQPVTAVPSLDDVAAIPTSSTSPVSPDAVTTAAVDSSPVLTAEAISTTQSAVG